MRKTTRIALTAAGAALVAALAVAAIFLWMRLAPVELDLTALAEYRQTQSYEALIRAIQSKPVPPEGFKVVVLGDSRSNIGAARQVFARVAEEHPAFVISNGDLVRSGTVEEYIAHHMRLVKQLEPIPFISAPGNHEEGPNEDFATFKAIYGGERFSFDYGTCLFVGVNNADGDGLSHEDLAFIEAELSKPGAEHRFVVFHVPPDFMKSARGRGFEKNAGQFREMMTRLKVDHVFVGHEHGYATEVIDGVPYTITGGAGANLSHDLGPEGDVRNFMVLTIGPRGVRTEVVRLSEDTWTRTTIP